MKYPGNLKYTFGGIGIAIIVGLVISVLSSLPVGVVIIIVTAAMFLNGMLAEFEDNLPGGFNNPMSEEEIKFETKKRNKRLLPYRIILWSVFASLIIWMIWLYFTKEVQ